MSTQFLMSQSHFTQKISFGIIRTFLLTAWIVEWRIYGKQTAGKISDDKDGIEGSRKAAFFRKWL